MTRPEEEQNYFLNAISASTEGIAVTDELDRFIYVNPAHAVIYGYQPDELIGKTWRDITPPDIVSSTEKDVHAILHNRDVGIFSGEFPSLRKDGSAVLTEVKATAQWDGEGRYLGHICIVRDITERKQMEEKLKASETKYRNLVDNALVGIYQTNFNGDILYVNETLSNMLEFNSPEEMMSTKLQAIYKNYENRMILIERLKREGKVSDFVSEVLTKTGKAKFLLFSAVLEGDILSGMVMDITERKKIEERFIQYGSELESLVEQRTLNYKEAMEALLEEIGERRNAEEKLRRNRIFMDSILNSIQDGISVIDTDMNILLVNRTIEKWYSFRTPILFKAQKCFEAYHGRTEPCELCQAVRSVETRTMHIQIVRTGNTCMAKGWQEVYAFPFLDEKNNVVGVVEYIRDITSRVQAEDELSNTLAKYRSLYQEFNILLNAISDIIILLSPDLKVVWANSAAVETLEKEFFVTIGRHCYKLWFNRDAPCDDCYAIKCFDTGEIAGSRIAIPGNKILDISAFPVKDEKGGVKNVLVTGRDVSEKLKIEEAAKRTSHLAQLGQLSAGIAHEINNPNNFIIFNAEILKNIWEDVFGILYKHYEDNGDFSMGGLPFSDMHKNVPYIITGIIDGSRRIKNIVNGLKEYSGCKKSGFDEGVDISSVVRSAVLILGNQIKKSTDNFNLDMRGNVPLVRGNRNKIEQVIVNLILNALEALPGRKAAVCISTLFDEQQGYVVVEVRDEGIGMTEDVLEHVFEPFFTTKHLKGGTGLGLAVSYSIVKDHRGILEFETYPDRGTTAVLKLPANNHGGQDF